MRSSDETDTAEISRLLTPWEHETHEERARRVAAEADRLQLAWELERAWRLAVEPAPCEALPTPMERPRKAG